VATADVWHFRNSPLRSSVSSSRSVQNPQPLKSATYGAKLTAIWPLTRSDWRAVADRTGVPALDVEIVCSDAVEHRRRVETRAADITGHSLPTWQEVVERDYRPWDGERIVIDTGRLSVEQSVRTILAQVAADR
jgi:hypothetical protein